MSQRAYVTPKLLVGVLNYLNPNNELLNVDKILIPLDSVIQKLNPGNNNRNIELPDPIYCEGMVFFIINSSIGIGELVVCDAGQINILENIRPNTYNQFFCIDSQWCNFNPSSGGVAISTSSIIEEPYFTDSTDDLQSIIDGLDKYIPPYKKITLYVTDGTYTSTNNNILELRHFYGGGEIAVIGKNINSNDEPMSVFHHTAMGSSIIMSECDNIKLTLSKIRLEPPIGQNGVTITNNLGKFNINTTSLYNIGIDNTGVGIYINADPAICQVTSNIEDTHSHGFEDTFLMNGNIYCRINTTDFPYTPSTNLEPNNVYHANNGAKIAFSDNHLAGNINLVFAEGPTSEIIAL